MAHGNARRDIFKLSIIFTLNIVTPGRPVILRRDEIEETVLNRITTRKIVHGKNHKKRLLFTLFIYQFGPFRNQSIKLVKTIIFI